MRKEGVPREACLHPRGAREVDASGRHQLGSRSLAPAIECDFAEHAGVTKFNTCTRERGAGNLGRHASTARAKLDRQRRKQTR